MYMFWDLSRLKLIRESEGIMDKYKMMLDIFEYLVKYEAGVIMKYSHYEERMEDFKLRRDVFFELVGTDKKGKNDFKYDGSLEEDLEKRIWIILNRLRID